MAASRGAIALALITMVSGWGTAAITNWDKLDGENGNKQQKYDDRDNAISALNYELDKLKEEANGDKKKIVNSEGELAAARKLIQDQQQSLAQKDIEIADLKVPFHNISNPKLRQLMMFHNDARCYGTTLNFTHPADDSYSHCVSKESLSKRFISFLEELGIVKDDVGIDYSRARAKRELVALQEKHNFDELGWYGEFTLAILILEYAKKSG
jgi:hypothetical protein